MRRRIPLLITLLTALCLTPGLANSKPLPASNGALAQGTTQATPPATPAATDLASMSEMDRELAQLNMAAQGPADKPWEQMLPPIDMLDTNHFKKNPPWHICFSNASLSNSWRILGVALLQYEVKQHPEIPTFTATDAADNPKKQVADIDSLLTKGCDLLIVSPSTTLDLTPAVDRAAATGIPVIVFDRGVNTTSYTTYVHPIGGLAFGYSGASWLAQQMGGKGNLLALRLAPNVDIFDARWQAAKSVFDNYPNIKVIGVEFDNGDPVKASSITLDYL